MIGTLAREAALTVARTQPEPGTDAKAFLAARATAIREAYGTVTADDTEPVKVADLNVGDVITELGTVKFPFPFHLTRILDTPAGRMLFAAHGWGSMRFVATSDRAARLV